MATYSNLLFFEDLSLKPISIKQTYLFSNELLQGMSILDNSQLNIFSPLYPGRPGSKMQKVPSKEKRKESAKPKEKVCNSINYSSEKIS